MLLLPHAEHDHALELSSRRILSTDEMCTQMIIYTYVRANFLRSSDAQSIPPTAPSDLVGKKPMMPSITVRTLYTGTTSEAVQKMKH